MQRLYELNFNFQCEDCKEYLSLRYLVQLFQRLRDMPKFDLRFLMRR
jgi:arginyl-tRNA--protein-N-Asp/Glu arginylyltransferase